MKQRLLRSCLATLLVTGFLAQPANGFAQTTAFTYQGRLHSGTSPASGTFDFRFSIFDLADGGSALAGPLTNSAVGVSNGLFTTSLDFGGGAFTRNEIPASP